MVFAVIFKITKFLPVLYKPDLRALTVLEARGISRPACWDDCQGSKTFKWCTAFQDTHANARAFTESSCAEITILETCVGKLSLKHGEKEWNIKLTGLCPSPREYHILDLKEYSTLQVKVTTFFQSFFVTNKDVCKMFCSRELKR